MKSLIMSKINYYFWKIKNPNSSYSDFYVAYVSKRLSENRQHPTLGHNIKDMDRFNKTAEIEKEFLIEQGLKPSHKFVDYGCGSLRLGRKIIPYLNQGCYIGIDVNKQFIDVGLENMEPGILKTKVPVFLSLQEKKEISFLIGNIDYLFSSAVLYHIPPNELRSFLNKIISLLKTNGMAFIDFTYSNNIQKASFTRWLYPKNVIISQLKGFDIKTNFLSLKEKHRSYYPINHTIIKLEKLR